MNSLSPAAQAFWGSVIRHILTGVAGVLVAHGYVSNDVTHPYVEEGVGIALQGAVMLWANRIVYWQQVRALVGRAMPVATHTEVIAKVEELKAAQALPSVFTPSTSVPSLVKPSAWLIAAILGTGVLVSSCGPVRLPHLPDGSLDVRTLVTWASDGVEADCQFAPLSSFCIFGRDAVADVRAAMDKNPTGIQVAAKRSITDSVEKWPAIAPWFTWLADAL